MKLCAWAASVASVLMEGIERDDISWIWTESSVRPNELGTNNSHQNLRRNLWLK